MNFEYRESPYFFEFVAGQARASVVARRIVETLQRTGDGEEVRKIFFGTEHSGLSLAHLFELLDYGNGKIAEESLSERLVDILHFPGSIDGAVRIDY